LAALGSMGDVLVGLEKSVSAIDSALPEWEQAGGDIRTAVQNVSLSAEKLASALAVSASLTGEVTALFADLAAMPSLRFTKLNQSFSDSRQAFIDALRSMNVSLDQLATRLDDQTITDDLALVTDQLDRVTDCVIDLLDGVAHAGYTEEGISDTRAKSSASVVGCANFSPVRGNTNVGGVVGAVTLELSDSTDRLDLQGLLTKGSVYTIYALVDDSRNFGTVTADKSVAGGIVGKLSYGLVYGCKASTDVSSGGNYVGGIVGSGEGSVRLCYARVNLSGENYVGGIVGSGFTVRDCAALAHIDGFGECYGSIAGYADGTIEGNRYVGEIGGVDGFTYSGQTDPVTAAELYDVDVFREMTVVFETEEGRTALSVAYGEEVTAPAVPDRDGMRWVWDAFDPVVTRSFTVKGQYVRPVTVLQSEGEIPSYLVEGIFFDGETLSVSESRTEDGALSVTVQVDRYDGMLTVHMRAEEGGTLYLHSEEGLQECAYTRDGSYLVFTIGNGDTITYVMPSPVGKILLIVGLSVLGVAAATGVVLLVLSRRKKKRKA
ncbi:MAG: hypothetical protein ACI4U2_03350, partial [Christensenellaceae bacterium]